MDASNQQYVDAGTLQDQGMHGMDAAAIAAAAQQLEAIHAALQQAGTSMHSNDQMTVAALEHLHATKPEDYLAHLAVVNAVAASAAENAGVNGHQHLQLVDMQNDMDGQDPSQGGDKPLTSRFRGVCWNKKNRRWQAAINSSGKYIYLGSFVQEEEAARAFDKAAIRLRGNRAKLNYSLSDYVDDAGNLVDDPRLSAHLQNVLGKEGGKGSKGGALDAPEVHASLLAAPVNQQNMMYGQNLAQVRACMHILGQGKSPHYPYSGAQKQAYGVLDVPDGCSLVAHIVGDEEAFAVLYIGPHVPQGGLGALVWDGSGAIDLGVFETDKDARNAAGAVLKLAMFHKHTLTSALSATSEQNAAQQQATAAGLAQYGMLLGGTGAEQAGSDGDAAAMAAAAAAAASDPSALAQQLGLVANLAMPQGLDPSQQNQYKDLFSWLASAAPRAGKGDEAQDLGAQGDGAAGHQHTEAEVAGAEAMAAMMMSVHGGLKNLRDEEHDADEGGGKRSRNDDGMAQMKNLSGFKLQDVMKSLFDPSQQAQQGNN